MKLGFAKWVVIVSAFIMSGAPTVLMQVGAWGIMVGWRGESVSVGNAIRLAFLGNEPCQRCELIAISVGEDQSGDADLRWVMAEQLLDLRRDAILLPGREIARPILIYSFDPGLLKNRSEGPPTPPPRWS